jgi:hypothetical protein
MGVYRRANLTFFLLGENALLNFSQCRWDSIKGTPQILIHSG